MKTARQVAAEVLVRWEADDIQYQPILADRKETVPHSV